MKARLDPEGSSSSTQRPPPAQVEPSMLEKGVEQGVPVILVVCGGNIVNTSLLEQWRRETAE